MELKISQNEIQALRERLHHLSLVSVCLLISNIFLVWLVGWSFLHQKRTIVPAEIKEAFTISDSSVDASYLRQMALFFVEERLNLTPSNIDQNHSILLQYIDPKFYHAFVRILVNEKQAVIKQNISSVFYPDEVIPDTHNLTVLIKGSLMHWVGALSLPPTKKSYVIKFGFRSGYLKILSFSEKLEKKQTDVEKEITRMEANHDK